MGFFGEKGPPTGGQENTHENFFLETHILSWSRLSEQNLRVDKWSICRG